MRRRTNNSDRDRRGFTSMDRERQREISSRGKRHSHDGRDRDYDDHNYNRSRNEEEFEDESYDTDGSNFGYGRVPERRQRGYASMDDERSDETSFRDNRNVHIGRGRYHEEDEYPESRTYQNRYRKEEDYGFNDRDSGNYERSDRRGRGFASMEEDRQREISARDGRSAHRSGNAHEFSREERRRGGQRGGRSRSH
jgi:hypothetical protein